MLAKTSRVGEMEPGISPKVWVPCTMLILALAALSYLFPAYYHFKKDSEFKTSQVASLKTQLSKSLKKSTKTYYENGKLKSDTEVSSSIVASSATTSVTNVSKSEKVEKEVKRGIAPSFGPVISFRTSDLKPTVSYALTANLLEIPFVGLNLQTGISLQP